MCDRKLISKPLTSTDHLCIYRVHSCGQYISISSSQRTQRVSWEPRSYLNLFASIILGIITRAWRALCWLWHINIKTVTYSDSQALAMSHESSQTLSKIATICITWLLLCHSVCDAGIRSKCQHPFNHNQMSKQSTCYGCWNKHMYVVNSRWQDATKEWFLHCDSIQIECACLYSNQSYIGIVSTCVVNQVYLIEVEMSFEAGTAQTDWIVGSNLSDMFPDGHFTKTMSASKYARKWFTSWVCNISNVIRQVVHTFLRKSLWSILHVCIFLQKYPMHPHGYWQLQGLVGNHIAVK